MTEMQPGRGSALYSPLDKIQGTQGAAVGHSQAVPGPSVLLGAEWDMGLHGLGLQGSRTTVGRVVSA